MLPVIYAVSNLKTRVELTAKDCWTFAGSLREPGEVTDMPAEWAALVEEMILRVAWSTQSRTYVTGHGECLGAAGDANREIAEIYA